MNEGKRKHIVCECMQKWQKTNVSYILQEFQQFTIEKI